MTHQHTPLFNLPYPEGSDVADVPADFQALAVAVEAALAQAKGALDTINDHVSFKSPRNAGKVLYLRPGAPGAAETTLATKAGVWQNGRVIPSGGASAASWSYTPEDDMLWIVSTWFQGRQPLAGYSGTSTAALTERKAYGNMARSANFFRMTPKFAGVTGGSVSEHFITATEGLVAGSGQVGWVTVKKGQKVDLTVQFRRDRGSDSLYASTATGTTKVAMGTSDSIAAWMKIIPVMAYTDVPVIGEVDTGEPDPDNSDSNAP
jgi:hypothetical protein